MWAAGQIPLNERLSPNRTGTPVQELPSANSRSDSPDCIVARVMR